VDISGSTPHPDEHRPQPDLSSAASGDPSPEAGGGAEAVGGDPAQHGPADASAAVQTGSAASRHLFRYLAVYTVLRLALVVVLTAALAFFMPLIVALLFAIIAQLPLAWLLFAGPRRRVNEAIAETSAQRRAERARLQSALSGDADPS
jgi:hypothetical protein